MSQPPSPVTGIRTNKVNSLAILIELPLTPLASRIRFSKFHHIRPS
jgi:hypothetical protein